MSIKNILLKNPSSPAFWLLLGFIFKGIIPFVWMLHSNLPREIAGLWGATGPDTSSYLMPIDNWLAHGTYEPDFRMPGYGWGYLFFRLMCSKALACNMVIIVQFLLTSVSMYYIALTARLIFNSNKVFYACFYILLISSFPNIYDGYIQSESLCTSFLIFSAYLFAMFFTSKRILHLFFSSVFLTWAIFTRPGFALLVPLFALVLIFKKRNEIKVNIKYAIIFLLPFIIVDGIWMARNYIHSGKINPLTTTGNYPNIEFTYLGPLFYFVQGWGGAYSFRKKEPDVSWFEYTYPGRIKPAHYDSLPNYIYTSAYNKYSLLHLKKLIIALQNPLIDSATANAYQRELITKFRIYKKSLQREKPFLYYVQTPLKLTAIFLYGAMTRGYLDRGQTLGRFNFFLCAYSNIIYLSTLVLGITGMITLFLIGFKKNILFIFIAMMPLYTIIIHCFLIRKPDARFFMPTWCFMIICEAYIISLIWEKLFRNNG